MNHSTLGEAGARDSNTFCCRVFMGVPSAYDRLRPLKKIFVHVDGWHNPYTPSPTPSSPPGLPPSVPSSVQCINPLKERHITID